MAKRYTILIGPDGRIAHRFEKVDPATHAGAVLEAIRRSVPSSGDSPESEQHS
jgi:peroxiredoxin